MLSNHIFLSHQAATLYLGVTSKEVRKLFPSSRPIALSALAKVQIDWGGSADDQTILCLKTPAKGYGHALEQATFPIQIRPELLTVANDYLTNAPFLLSVFDILGYLNDHQLHKQMSVSKVAECLSNQGFFEFHVVVKADPNYKPLLAQLNNPSVALKEGPYRA
jgi:hypothetical protein